MTSFAAVAGALIALSSLFPAVYATACDFDGGYALRNPTGCPSNTTECGGGQEARCCPDSLHCWENSSAYCCPSEDVDCWDDLQNVPQCPLTDWTMWATGSAVNGSWCCESDEFGVSISGQGVGCTDYGSTLAPGETTATQITTASTKCTTVSASTATGLTASTSSSARPGSTTSSSQGTATATAAGTIGSKKSSGSSISGGAIAGIVVGVVVGIVLVLVAAWAVWRRKRRQAPYQPEEAVVAATNTPGNAPSPMSPAPVGSPPVELKGTPHPDETPDAAELKGTPHPDDHAAAAELGGATHPNEYPAPVELPAGDIAELPAEYHR
ncbi:hypothetical protein CMQ_497 [Grosmannia clavigera kw1407]|uniref:Cfem domain containing protein n=1 Tax=Grosmannia clavigera (strain kw1407 / UAMH 11150) TaxID=655863 RepID=F0XCK8_GROCL|nr:uncharacterized protein CMQ_497 [Grosmannia clavigera kw1407]EFX03569.1 hypothetical protein CMQ_497 [Grosmannia clavigera kw1407]